MSDLFEELEVNVSEVIVHQRLTGKFAGELRAVVELKLAIAAARKAGLVAGDDELQKTFDIWRVSQGLHKSEEMNAWLKMTGISLEAVEEYLEGNILISKFKDKLQRECNIQEYVQRSETQELIREMVFNDWLTSTLA